MNILITGASGFIGRRLVDRILSRGDAVCYFGRKRASNMDTRASFYAWDPNENPPLDSTPRLDAVINLMGEPIAQRWTADVKKRISDSRVLTTRKLVDGLAKQQHKPPVLVSASAVGYYGNRGGEVLTETSAPGEGFLPSVCVAWENEALRAREAGLRVALIRIGVVLGREGGALPQMLTPFRLGLGAKFGDGRQWMPWIQIADLVRLMLFAVDLPHVNGPLNAASPNAVTNADFTAALAQALHRPALFTAPKFALKAALGEMSEFLFDSVRAVPAAALKAGFSFDHATLPEALAKSV